MICNFQQVIPATIDISDYSCFSTCIINTIIMYTFCPYIYLQYPVHRPPFLDYTSSVLVNLFSNCPAKLFVPPSLSMYLIVDFCSQASLFTYLSHLTFQFPRIQLSLPFSSNLIYGDSTRQVQVWKANPITQWHKFYHAISTAHWQFIPIINNNLSHYYWQLIIFTTVNLSQLLIAIYHNYCWQFITPTTVNLSQLLTAIYHNY